MFKQLIPALRATLLLTIVTGLIYPGIVTGVCQLLFPRQANGSLLSRNGHIIGSSLLGQNFSKPEYLHPRPSAAGTDGYDPTASSGSNYGPTNQKLFDRVKASAAQFHKENPTYKGDIPADALTASGSGLDPDISAAYAQIQVQRIAETRHVPTGEISKLLAAHTQGRNLGILGEPRVNVLATNLALDEQFPRH